MTFHLENHWLILALMALALAWGASLAATRYMARRQLLKTLVQKELHPEEVRLNLPDSRPEDEEALKLIRDTRRRYLLSLWPGTELSFKTINEMSVKLVQEIAQVYHPEEERPELKASLSDLVALHNRVGSRLAAWLETYPMKPFKDLEIKTVLRYHELYQSVKQHRAYAYMQRHHLDKVARWGWAAFNYANPWYWGRRAAYHGSKEMVARLLLGRIAEMVGEEAVLLYGRRR
jgi:hypothetical protein